MAEYNLTTVCFVDSIFLLATLVNKRLLEHLTSSKWCVIS